MTGTPEVPLPQPDAGGQSASVQEVPQAPEVTPSMYESGVAQSGSGTPPPAPVVADPVQPIAVPVSDPSTVKTITIPVNQQQLLDLAKGEPDKAVTWLAKFWIRKIKQSVRYGWHLVMPPPLVPPAQGGSGVQPVQQVQTAPVAPQQQSTAVDPTMPPQPTILQDPVQPAQQQ